MSRPVVKVGDKIVTLKNRVFGTDEPKGTVLTVVSLKNEKDPNFNHGDFYTGVVTGIKHPIDTWYWMNKCFDDKDIALLDLSIFNELGD